MLNIGNGWDLVVDATLRPLYYLKRASVDILDPHVIADFVCELCKHLVKQYLDMISFFIVEFHIFISKRT